MRSYFGLSCQADEVSSRAPPERFLSQAFCFFGETDFKHLSLNETSALPWRKAQFYAFDVLVSGGDDLRSQPLFLLKGALARLLKRRVDGITLNDFERGEIGPDLFKAACQLGLEGLVSKRRDRPYRAGRSPHWVKVKNPASPAMNRAKDAF